MSEKKKSESSGPNSTSALRQKAVVGLGGKCVKCGFGDPRALQIDHIAGDGVKDRKHSARKAQLYKAVLTDGSGRFQLLCYNCHRIKTIENGEHLPLNARFAYLQTRAPRQPAPTFSPRPKSTRGGYRPGSGRKPTPLLDREQAWVDKITRDPQIGVTGYYHIALALLRAYRGGK